MLSAFKVQFTAVCRNVLDQDNSHKCSTNDKLHSGVCYGNVIWSSHQSMTEDSFLDFMWQVSDTVPVRSAANCPGALNVWREPNLKSIVMAQQCGSEKDSPAAMRRLRELVSHDVRRAQVHLPAKHKANKPNQKPRKCTSRLWPVRMRNSSHTVSANFCHVMILSLLWLLRFKMRVHYNRSVGIDWTVWCVSWK